MMRFPAIIILFVTIGLSQPNLVESSKKPDAKSDSLKLKIGDIAPTFYLNTLDGKRFYLSKTLEKKKPIVLSFFATWCEPCKKEMPVLETLSKEFEETDFYLVNVSNLVQGGKKLKEDPKLVQRLVDGLKLTMTVLMDKYALVAKKYEAMVLPRLAIIAPDGKVSYLHTGYEYGDEKEIVNILNQFKSPAPNSIESKN